MGPGEQDVCGRADIRNARLAEIPRQFSGESWSINSIIVMIKLQRSPLGRESVNSLFHHIVMVKNGWTRGGGAPSEWVMQGMQTWKKNIFSHCANPAQFVVVWLNLERTIKWKSIPFGVRKNSSANRNIPLFLLLCWFTNLADSQPSRVQGLRNAHLPSFFCASRFFDC